MPVLLRIPLTGFRSHQFVQLGILGEAIDKGHLSGAIQHPVTASFGIGNEAHLLVVIV